MATKDKIKNLADQIIKHKALYYQGRPEIADHIYDKLEEDLRKLAPGHPALALVGTEVTSPNKLQHNTKMLSLNKTYKLDELKKWIEEENVISMRKIDGSSCSLIYKEGKLATGKTRGDGQFGEDVSGKVAWIENIPKEIALEECEVRGEIYCDEESFFKLSEEMESLGLERPNSQRNIVAGLLGRKENIELCRYLKFFAFEIISDEIALKKEWDKIKLLEEELGFCVPAPEYHLKQEGIEDVIKETEIFIAEGDYLVDGIVFTYDNIVLHDELGSTAHHPRFKIAFKFQGESKKTQIEEIIWSVSRKGNLTPVANVNPVILSGAKISRVTLHNYGQVKQHNLKKGDEIEIIRSGEVIPKFLAVTKASRNKFKRPSQCPTCETKVKVKEIHLICPNKKCPGRIKEGILNFIQKIGIDDLSSKRLDGMLLQGLIGNIADLYRLDKEKLLTLEKTKEKLATKILSEIEKSKRADLVTFLSALGISGGAYNKCEKIVHAGFNSIEKLKAMTEEDLHQVELFAEKSSQEFMNSLRTKWKTVNELMDLGFQLKAPKVKKGVLTGKKLVVTGALSRKRSEIEKEVKLCGGVISSAVSKGTDYLVTNDPKASSTKLKKARELKIAIISEKKLFEMMK